MLARNSGYYAIAILAASLGLLLVIRRRIRWGLVVFEFLLALGEKWREKRLLNKIQPFIPPEQG